MTTVKTIPQQEDDTYRRSRRFARECALQFLYQSEVQDDVGNFNVKWEEFWTQIMELEGLPVGCSADTVRKFAQRLCEGVLAKQKELDDAITEQVRNWRLGRMNMIDRNILRLAAYEIMFCEDIPPVASMDEAIELAKEFGDRDSSRFVNGILDQILKKRAQDS